MTYDRQVSDRTAPFPATIAAVDLGSNSFHMIVARPNAGEVVVLDRMREMVRLAAGLDEKKHISGEARDRAVACLRRFGERVGHMPPGTVRAVGTDTLRQAKNAAEFLGEFGEALGHPIDTISGMEEARLVYLGVARSLPAPHIRRLVLDIGGGSTEVVIGERFRPILMESLYLGCVSMSRTFFGDGVITPERWRDAKLAALAELAPIRGRFRATGWEQAVGASGTIRAINGVVRAAGWSNGGIRRKTIKRLRDHLLAAGHVNELNLKALNPERLPVFPGGVAIAAALFEALGIEEVHAADGALRDGLLHDLLGRIREEDVRTRSVAALANRYHVDAKQAARVESTALALLDQVADAWRIGSKEARQLLSWAARLHEAGLDIAHSRYHKHGQYIIEQSDLFGFTREEQRFLGTLVLAHRRKFPVAEIRALPPVRAREIERLAILLRLAVLLHRSRDPAPLPAVALTAEKKRLDLRFPAGWLDRHWLTRADLGRELAYLRVTCFRLDYS